MKQFFYVIAILSIALTGVLSAQDTESSGEEAAPVISSTDTDNPGMGLLDQATEAKLRANTVADLSQVIVLCQRARKAGLSGENLEYCDQLLAATQLSRGLFLAQELAKSDVRAGGNRQELTRRALIDLEEAVAVIKDQPSPYLQIARLNLLPDGNENRAKEALRLAIQHANKEPEIQVQSVLLLANLEPEAEKRKSMLETAAKNGSPQIVLLYALTLFELKQNNEARDILKKLVTNESDNIGLHERIIVLLAEFKEYESAMSILDTLREKNTDGELLYRIDLKKAKLFAQMKQYDKSLQLLNTLNEKFQENTDLMMQTLELRCLVHLAMDNPEEALIEIEAAEKTHQNNPLILEQKYDILVELEKFNDALSVAKTLQSLAESPQGLLREILVLNELGEYDTAIEQTKKLQEKYPENASGWTAILVEIHCKQETYDKAMMLVEEQLNEHPGEFRWIGAKNKVLLIQKKWDDAVTWLEACLQKDPDSRTLNLLLIETLLISKKNYKAVRERVKLLLETDPDNPNLLQLDSQAAISLGLHFEAVKILAKLIEADPEDYTSINNLAWILCTSPIDSIRNGQRAVELAEKAGELTNYKRAFVLSTLAAAYAEAGDFNKAREMSQKSVDVANTERGKTKEERQEMIEHLQKEWDCFKQDMPYRELMENV